MPEHARIGRRADQRTPWDIVFGRTPVVEGLGKELYAAFGTIFERLRRIALPKDASVVVPFGERKAATLKIWGLQQADRLLALRLNNQRKDVPVHETDRFKDLSRKQMATILSMQRELLSAARALKEEQEATPPSDGQPDTSAPL